MDTRLDETRRVSGMAVVTEARYLHQAELAILVLAVALEVLADGNGLLDKEVCQWLATDVSCTLRSSFRCQLCGRTYKDPQESQERDL